MDRWLLKNVDKCKVVLYGINVKIDADYNIQGGPKNWHNKIGTTALTLLNINRFSKFFHCQNQEKICNNVISKDPSTPQVCRYTTLWNISVLKATK